MFHFLDLPRELRDRIYAIFLNIECKAPKSPEEPSKRWRDTDASHMLRYNSSGSSNTYRNIWYETKPLTFACTGLLRCNHQISQEVIEVLDRKCITCGRCARYKLDCMVDGEGGSSLWLSWTALPAPLKYIHRAEIDFRDFTGRGGISWSGHYGTATIVSNLLGLLGQFFTSGPQFTCRSCYQRNIMGDRPLICPSCSQIEVHLRVLVSKTVCNICPASCVPSMSQDMSENDLHQKHVRQPYMPSYGSATRATLTRSENIIGH